MRRVLLTAVLFLLLPALASAQNQPPVANAGPDQSIYTGDLASLQGSATDPDGDAIIYWIWSEVEAPVGSTWNLYYEDRPNAQFQALSPGDYVLALAVVDANHNGSLADYVTIHVADNLPPVAVVTADRTSGPAPLTVCFDGSQSYDPEGAFLTYYWNFGDGSDPDRSVMVCHEFLDPGLYSVTFGVTDIRGATDSEVLSITVVPAAAVPSQPRSGLWLLGLLLSLVGAVQISRRVEGEV